jgi:UDP-N-acetylmuramate--alanine ligase
MNTVISNIKRVFLVGIGGIGMSALARYFNYKGITVAGYDSTPSQLTETLESEGIQIHFTDCIDAIPLEFLNSPSDTLVIFTPAIPQSHSQLSFFQSNGYTVLKRAQTLGLIANDYKTAAIAGTHGKTSTTTMLAHLLSSTPEGCNAFLGGISKNFQNNLVLNDNGGKRMVVEADEFDRSFLNLYPQLAIITSIDADHLDIYKTHHEVKLAFADFIKNITPNGVLIIKKGLEKIAEVNPNIKIYTYSASEKADFYPDSISCKDGLFSYSLVTPFETISKITLGVLGKYNVENAVAASAAALLWGIDSEILITGLKTFKGIARRFDLQHQGNTVYIDDYAHHPEEIRAAVSSAREMFPKSKITGIFQPHLYSRTKDFANEFAESLSLLDELILLDIYPARELPIPGVTSEIIFNNVTCKVKELCSLSNLIDKLKTKHLEVLITMGAGNIDREVPNIAQMLKEKEKK